MRLPKLPVRAPRIGEHGDARNSPSLGSFPRMSEPLPVIMENSIQIAWDYLERMATSVIPRLRARCCWSRWKPWLGVVNTVS